MDKKQHGHVKRHSGLEFSPSIWSRENLHELRASTSGGMNVGIKRRFENREARRDGKGAVANRGDRRQPWSSRTLGRWQEGASGYLEEQIGARLVERGESEPARAGNRVGRRRFRRFTCAS